jgi:predicted nicotinamide N-methyase
MELVEETVAVGAHRLSLLRPPDSEALLSEDAFEHEEFLPYWAELWPSGVALARALAARDPHGARVLELGCGLGLPSIAAALAGADVLATDWSPDAVRLAATNAERNAAPLQTALWSWTEPPPGRPPWDLVLGADVLYERRNVPQLIDALPSLVARDGEAWIADPGRPFARDFVQRAALAWTLDTVPHDGPEKVTVHRLGR